MSSVFQGFISACLAACADSGNQLVVGKSKKEIGATALACLTICGIAIVYSPFLFISAPIHPLPYWFWPIIFLRAFLEVFAIVSYFTALQEDELSLTTPLANLKPLFILAFVVASGLQRVTVLGAVGVACIFIGSLWLQHQPELGIGAILKKRSARRMLFSTLIWAIGDSMLVYATKAAIVSFCAAAATAAFGILILGYTLIAKRTELFESLRSRSIRPVALSVGTDAIAFFAMLQGYALWNASYVSSIRYMSGAITSIAAGIFFKERIGKRAAPILLMTIGGIALALVSH